LAGRVLYFLIGFSLFIPCRQVTAQWVNLIHTGGTIKTIYFSEKSPDIGFIGLDGTIQIVYKTTDGGYHWTKPTISGHISQVTDFCFKDSLIGWFSSTSGCFKTTDGGETWNVEIASVSLAQEVFYNSATGLLWLGTWGGLGDPQKLSYSSDEGSTWTSTGPPADGFNGFAFNDDLTGAVGGLGSGWLKTSNGGTTWNQAGMSVECWQPLAIRGTKTQFAIADQVPDLYRTNDLWDTYTLIHTFPPNEAPKSILPNDLPTNGCIRGDRNNLFVQFLTGCYRSTDQGVTWKYLCGLPTAPGYLLDTRTLFYKYPFVYLATEDSTTTMTNLWRLNLDSMQYFKTRIELATGSNVNAGQDVIVEYFSEQDEMIGIDSGHIVIRFDDRSLTLRKLKLPDSWIITDSSIKDGILDLRIKDTGALRLPSPIMQLTFGTAIGTLHPYIVLDSAHLFGKRLNCDCQALSNASRDSIEIDFTGCEDSVLLHYLQTREIPFSIESVVPNPALEELIVEVRQNLEGSIVYQLIDALGRIVLRGGDIIGESLHVNAIPSGVYYLRLSQAGFTKLKRVVIQH